jgi:hypothetical protein
MSTTMLRVQQGMPVVSQEKLPRWALQGARAGQGQGQGQAGGEQRELDGQQAQLPAGSKWAQQLGEQVTTAGDGGGQAAVQVRRCSPAPLAICCTAAGWRRCPALGGQCLAQVQADLAPHLQAGDSDRAQAARAVQPQQQQQQPPQQQPQQQQQQHPQQHPGSPVRQAPNRTWADTLDDDDEIVYFSHAADEGAGLAFDVNDVTEDLEQAMQVRAWGVFGGGGEPAGAR